MPQQVHEVLTLPQFLRMPEVKPALEFIRGRIVQKVSPNLHHSLIATRLAARINDFAEPSGVAIALNELRCSFAGESYVPDLSVFLAQRLPLNENGEYAERAEIAPDLSIEIVSPEQTVAKLTARLHRCIAKGVRSAWLIQPRRRRVFVFGPERSVVERSLDETIDGSPVLPGFQLSVAELFGWLSPRR